MHRTKKQSGNGHGHGCVPTQSLPMSAFAGKADIAQTSENVCFCPKADIDQFSHELCRKLASSSGAH